MAQALYAPGLGYYANASRKFGQMPSSGSDFVTAPEMTPLFGRALAAQVADALSATGTDEVWEFGAGSGALALQLLQALGDRVRRYTIVDLSGTLIERQRDTLAAFADKVEWASELPESMRGVVVGNEVLDAMPVKLLVRTGGVWHERGVGLRQAQPEREKPFALSMSKGSRGSTAPPTCARPSTSKARTTTSPKSIRRPKRSSAPWPIASCRARPSSSTTGSAKASTTTRSATWAR